MKNKLIIISDLWGSQKAQWLTNYTKILETNFDITFYDCCEIGKVDISNYSQESLHHQFIEGAIDEAVDYLVQNERNLVDILAFSIGGVIAWNYGLRTNNIKSLTCISSTRLRKETKRPKGRIKLLFGENDEFKPNHEWINKMELECEIIKDKNHLMYTETELGEVFSLSVKSLDS
ncbi:hypothetical protein [Flammeovirga sp. SubArs3]|uniref:hypothetical protein n=1 Tax=Flammeovirga sp. SubArs3 TaxID=2995316 RepID=UPI00248B6AF1|nr:hypothetical protein [Flammeovirga sp. SubArs3]